MVVNIEYKVHRQQNKRCCYAGAFVNDIMKMIINGKLYNNYNKKWHTAHLKNVLPKQHSKNFMNYEALQIEQRKDSIYPLNNIETEK